MRRRTKERTRPARPAGAAGPKERGTWGGKRAGAGRKPKGARALAPHRARPKHEPGRPVLVTLRSSIGSLQSGKVLRAVREAIRGADRWDPESFRVVRSVVGTQHVHLIVEADDERTLSGGMRSVTIRIARSINEVLGRAGRFWADRWRGRELASKRAVGRALAEAVALARAIEAGKIRRLRRAERRGA